MASERVWTPEQQQVIRLRNRNLLVSAAAGSGKTAVLVERILSMITDPKHPIDVDRLLVVTFTRAAAAEMRERIGDALERALEQTEKGEQTEENGQTERAERLMNQATLLHSAQISTIDSFCKRVVEEHFHDIELDPGFRVADEAELLLTRADVCERMLEDYYEENSPEFREFAEMYASGKNDSALEEMILKLYGFAESYPDPAGWLAQQQREYREDTAQTRFFSVLSILAGQLLEGAKALNAEALRICRSPGGPYAYEAALLSDEAWLKETEQELQGLEKKQETAETSGSSFYEKLYVRLSGLSFTALSRKRQEDVQEEKKEQVKSLRDQMKKIIKELEGSFFFQEGDELQDDYEHTIPGVLMLLELAGEFRKRFAEKKRKNNLLDFSDLEHLALQVLVDPEGNPTEAAAEYRDFYEEILIDEYQDSNRIQEMLLTSISKEAEGRPNMFMVGDVKQSIYKFRQARPELFMEKYQSYQRVEPSHLTEPELESRQEPESKQESEASYQKIDLHKNFRSRAEVLDVTNQVFRRIMHRTLGGVEYDQDAALYLGASYPELSLEEKEELRPEILLLETEEGEEPVGSSQEEFGPREKEALLIVDRIRRLHKQGFAYGDMAILLRTMRGWSESFVRILTSEGIPAICDTVSGYFSAWEVQVILNLLRVLDNPRQDLPLASVLLSPIGGLTPEEVSWLRVLADRKERQTGLYEALLSVLEGYPIEKAAEELEERALRKAADFIAWVEEKRHQLIFTPVHEMIRQLLEETGFYRYASAMPAGRTRAANLSMLVQKAQAFEQTSYHGVFHFVRYIEKLHKYDVDYGEAGADYGELDMVRIMSIHKSKGLEFPVVFVAGMAKPFNQQDSRASVVLHPDLGIAVDYIDLERRQKAPTLAKKILQKQLIRDNLGEELRVLYVAFTRAREKLVLTGAVEHLEKKLEKWRSQLIEDFSIMKAGNYLDLVMPVVLSGERKTLRGDAVVEEGAAVAEITFALRLLRMEDLTLQEILAGEAQKRSLPVWQEESSLWEKMETELNWQYRYAAWQELKGKVTVTELKRLHLSEEEAGEIQFQGELSRETSALLEPIIPAFAAEEKKVEGGTRGTLYHRILERLPLSEVRTAADLEQYLGRMCQEGCLSEEERKALNLQRLVQFLSDPLAERIRQAEQKGMLHRESPFVLGVPAFQVYPALKGNEAGKETVLIQGIIDVWFEEEGQLVLLDYKTDAVWQGGEEQLLERYRIQLEHYRQALERLEQKKVKETLIYSFGLGRSVVVPEKEEKGKPDEIQAVY